MTLEWVRTAPCIYRSTTGGYVVRLDADTGTYTARAADTVIVEGVLLHEAMTAAQRHADSVRSCMTGYVIRAFVLFLGGTDKAAEFLGLTEAEVWNLLPTESD